MVPRVGFVVLILLFATLFSGCELTATGQAVRDVQETRGVIAPACSIGVELRVSEINGLSRTCLNTQLDILEVAVEALDRSIIGIIIQVEGVNNTINISHIPSKDSVVMRYEIPQVSKQFGQVNSLVVYPIAEVEGEAVNCDSHPLNIPLDIC